MTETATALAAPAEDAPASLSFDLIPGASRRWVVPGIVAEGEVTVDAGTGETAKSLRNAMFAARVALGLPMPGEDRDARHEPGRVLWVASGTEDDPIFDLSPRFAAALLACAAEFGLDPAEAQAGARRIHNLSEWEDGAPVFITDEGLSAIRAEAGKLSDLDEANRPRRLRDGTPNPEYTGPAWRVRFVVMDPLDALLGDGQTIDSRPGARRTMTGLARFARGTGAGVTVIHHVVASGTKIAGSPAVTNSVRLAFITRPDKANKQVKVMAKMKANVSSPDDIRYVIADGDPAPFVAFLGDTPAEHAAGDTLRGRIAASVPAGPASTPAGDAGTLRARVRAAARAEDPPTGPAGPCRLLRAELDGDGNPGPARYVGGTYPGPSAARTAARTDAGGAALTWTVPASAPGTEVAAVRVGGGVRSYAVVPARP